MEVSQSVAGDLRKSKSTLLKDKAVHHISSPILWCHSNFQHSHVSLIETAPWKKKRPEADMTLYSSLPHPWQRFQMFKITLTKWLILRLMFLFAFLGHEEVSVSVSVLFHEQIKTPPGALDVNLKNLHHQAPMVLKKHQCLWKPASRLDFSLSA